MLPEELTTRQMLYSGEGILGAVFTASPWRVFTGASAVSCLLLLLPALLLRLHSIPTSQGNLGVFYSPGWSVMYPLVIPLLLAMAGAVSRLMRNSVVELERDGRISPRQGQEGEPSYGQALSEYLRSNAKRLVLFALAISVVATLVDTYDLWIGYLPGWLPPPSRKPEWDTAFNASNWGPKYNSPEFLAYLTNSPGKLANLTFDIIAYCFQTAILFLAFLWVGTFTIYLFAFARLLGDQNPSHQFNPLTTDLERRMGLKPMGRVFDSFLAITLLIEAYAFYHRLHIIKLANQKPFYSYIVTTLNHIVFPQPSDTIPYPLTHFTELFKMESWAVNGLNVSAIITLLLMTVPIFVVCYLPLSKIRKIVEERRNEEIKKLQVEYSDALAAKNFDRVQLVEYEKQSLERTNIWPNGDIRAKRYLTIILALAAGALAPPLLAIVFAIRLSDSLSKYFKLIFNRT